MFCNQCGLSNPDSSQFCSRCGQPLYGNVQNTSANAVTPPQASAVSTSEQRTDGKAVASLILGVLSLTLFWIFTGIPAVILGHISRSAIRKSMGRLKGDGMALAGLIMGYLSLAALPFILIIAAIAIPNLLRARIAANEASAMAGVRTIAIAAQTYESTYPGKGYSRNLEQLGSPAAGEPDADHAGLVDRALVSGTKSGYRFEYMPKIGEIPGYFVRAVPVNAGSTGIRSFCTDETLVLRWAGRDEECTTDSPAL